MEKELMKKVKDFIVKESNNVFGFCGVAESEDFIMINTGKEKDLIIKIELK